MAKTSRLAAEISGIDEALRRALQEQVDLLELEKPKISEQVQRLLRTMLCARASSIEEVSMLMGMTRRTVARRLKAEGTTFKQLSDSVQFKIARHLIRNTSLSLTRISAALNYSEPSAFTRAFRKWSGMTPGEWRARNAIGCGALAEHARHLATDPNHQDALFRSAIDCAQPATVSKHLHESASSEGMRPNLSKPPKPSSD